MFFFLNLSLRRRNYWPVSSATLGIIHRTKCENVILLRRDEWMDEFISVSISCSRTFLELRSSWLNLPLNFTQAFLHLPLDLIWYPPPPSHQRRRFSPSLLRGSGAAGRYSGISTMLWGRRWRKMVLSLPFQTLLHRSSQWTTPSSWRNLQPRHQWCLMFSRFGKYYLANFSG